MLTRRLLLASLIASTALPSLAQDEAPRPRRWMMEDQLGNVITDDDLLGRFYMVAFGYTFCPDVCPTTMSVMADVLEALGPEAEKLTALFVTIDPARDTPKVLQEFVKVFDERILALRGPDAYTEAMVKAFNAKFAKRENTDAPEHYLMDHTASIAFVGPDGFLIERFPYGMSADDITTRIRAAMAT